MSNSELSQSQRGAMAQKGLNTEASTCNLCLEQLKEPVTVSCGHSFCNSCVHSYWDQEESKSEYSCPECRVGFSSRPVLGRNFKMEALLGQMKEAGLTMASMADSMAGEGEVPCDVCIGRKLKAVRSCLQCLVSYCKCHLKPHLDVPVLRQHQLVAPCEKLLDNLCSEHNEVKKMFCRSDEQLLCLVCCIDHHKGHDMVPSAAERDQRQTELEERKQQLLNTVKEREADLERLQEEANAISCSAQKAVQHSSNSFAQITLLLEKRRNEVEQQIRDQEKSELRQVQKLQEQVQKDINQRKETLAEMDILLESPDQNFFLQRFAKLPSHTQTIAFSTVPSEQLRYFESVTTAMSALKDTLQRHLTQSEAEVSTALMMACTPLSCRKGLLKYACDITLDPNTTHQRLCLTEGNRRVTKKGTCQNYPQHPERFRGLYQQVMSREALADRCYWEVELKGTKWVRLAVAYRDHEKSVYFGNNDRSWAFQWSSNSYYYKFNNVSSSVPGPFSSRLGMFLDHKAGLLLFYSIKGQTLSLIHKVQTTFTEPLHVGVWIWHDEHSVYFPQITQQQLCGRP